MKRNLLTLAALAATIGSVHAAKDADSWDTRTVEVPAYEGVWITDEVYKATLKEIKSSAKKKRSPSQAAVGSEAGMTDMYKIYRDRLLNIDTKRKFNDAGYVNPGDQLHGLILELDKNYANLPPDLQYFAAQLIPLKALRGVTFRMKPIVSKARVLHSQLLTAVQELASTHRVYFPQSHWVAGFAYVTEPYAGVEADGLIETEHDYQVKLLKNVFTELDRASARLKALKLNDPIVFDNKLAFGTTSFRDDHDRFRLVGEAERHATIAGLHIAASNLAAHIAYADDGGIEIRKNTGKLFGVDGFLDGKVSGVTSERRVAIVTKHKNYLRLYRNGGEWMARAWNHLKDGVTHAEFWWEAVEGRPSNPAFLVNPAIPNENRREIASSFKDLRMIVDGKDEKGNPPEIHSKSTGEKVVVSLKQFYAEPPNSLQIFFPKQWDQGEEFISKTVDENGKKKTYTYHNYFKGRPTEWNVATFQMIFPNAKSNDDITKGIRILSQSWGAWWATLPFAPIVL